MARVTQLSVRLSLLLVAIVAAFLLIGGAGADAGTPPSPPIEHVVSSGDTLWAVAAGHTEPGEDIRVMVEAIKRASGLSNSTLRPGQVLVIPQA